jgi:micrococcal nuclease
VAIWTFPILTYRVVDGDTVDCVIDRGFEETKRLVIRIQGIDAPELHTPIQKAAAGAVKRAVEAILEQSIMKLRAQTNKPDKYGGRYDGDIICQGLLSQILLDAGIVHPYDGQTKQPWTKAELDKIERFIWKAPT